MPWSRAKALPPPCNALFDACFRIQREAIEAAGHHIPLVVENVRGAQPWVGRARWNFGSYYLWGDVPALMPIVGLKKNNGGSWFVPPPGRKCGAKQNPDGRNPEAIPATDGIKPLNTDGYGHIKGEGGSWFGDSDNLMRQGSSKSRLRKAASAMIAKIPQPLSRHIAAVYRP